MPSGILTPNSVKKSLDIKSPLRYSESKPKFNVAQEHTDMRTITDHIVEGDSANHQLTIEVTDEPGQGGANHRYEIAGFDLASNQSRLPNEQYDAQFKTTIVFQNGPIKEFGVNGITQEALLAIVIDRLRSFQAGPFACEDNAIAQEHCEMALMRLQRRTRERIKRGVEGTHQA